MSAISPSSLCDICSTYPSCFASRLPKSEQGGFRHLFPVQKAFRRGRHLTTQGDGVRSIYLIKSGAFKSSIVSEDGFEQVLGFKHAGDVIGLDGLFKERQPSNAVALDDSIVCSVSMHDIKQLDERFSIIRFFLIAKLQNEISELSQMLIMINQMNSATRVVSFILGQSEKSTQMGLPTKQLRLQMTRGDIGSYLGLKIETVSRKLTELAQQGLIKIDHRMIKIEKSQELKNYQNKQLSRTQSP